MGFLLVVSSPKTPFYQGALDALSVSIGQTGSGQVGEELQPSEGGKRGNWGRRGWVCWNPLDSWILEIRTAASSEASAVIMPWRVHGLSKPRRDGRLGMCWRGVLRKSAHPPCFSSLWPEQALSCLKHWIMWQGKGTKKGKAGIWFGSYHLSGLGCYRSLMSWTWAKAVFAGDFLQPQGLILKAGPDTGQGLWLLWLRWGSRLRPPHFTKQKLVFSLKLGLEGEMVNHSGLQLTKQ